VAKAIYFWFQHDNCLILDTPVQDTTVSAEVEKVVLILAYQQDM
jgi:hypothetical protein